MNSPPSKTPASTGLPPPGDPRSDESVFRRLVDTVSDYAIFLLDPAGHVATWNAGAQRLKGWRADEIVGKHFSLFYPPDAVATGWPQEELRRAEADGRFEDEGWRLRKDGTRFWANVVITAVRGEDGGLIGFAKVTRDLTERRAQEERLRQSEESLRLVVEGVRDHAMFLIAPDGTVRSWNGGAARMLGWAADDIVGQPVARLYGPEDREAGRPLAELLAARHAGVYETDGWRRTAAGQPLRVHATFHVLREPNGALRGYAHILRDLRDRLRMAQLESEGERIHAFIAMLSHELRNPLAPIANAVRILQGRANPEDVRWCADLIGRQTSHLARLVDDLLDVSRVTRGKVRLQLRPLALDEVVRQAVEAQRPVIEAAGQALFTEWPASPVRVRGDPTRLHQVVTNLLSNATRYTPDGGRIDVVLRREEGLASLRVTDNGIGMSETLMQHAFEPFVQGSRALDRREGGLGIGLTLVKSVVELHGGRITVSSAGADRGTRFSITLPLLAEGDDATPARSAGATAGGASGGAPAQAPAPEAATSTPTLSRAPRRFLVVDDNEDAADSLGELLRLCGHHAEVVHDGPSALVAAAHRPPDVVLLDIGLPGMDGMEVARELRARGGVPRPRLVALTGYGQPADRAATAAAGFDAHLVKPVALEDLLREIDAPCDADDAARSTA